MVLNQSRININEKLLTVIGGGASGLLAAGSAAMYVRENPDYSQSIKIRILEKMYKPGLKLGITGKGRCNLSNNIPLEDFIEHFRPNSKFLYPAFKEFFSEHLITLLNKLNVKVKVERGGRIFPQSDSALQVVKALIQWNQQLGVDIVTDRAIKSIQLKKHNIYPFNIIHLPGKSIYPSSAVIISTGGITYPLTGSTGDGYKWAEKLGHKLSQPTPDLVGLYISTPPDWNLTGSLKLKNIRVTISLNNKNQHQGFGDAEISQSLFEGPVILKLSRFAVAGLKNKQKVELELDLKPALSENQLDRRLIKELNRQGNRSLVNILKTIIPLKLIDSCIYQTGINRFKKGGQITSSQRRKICFWIKHNRFKVDNYNSLDRAIITGGGVVTDGINPKTLMSRYIPGLFFSGEIIDYAADTGGFNLQAAFSTGWLAGKSSVDYLNSI